MGIFGSIGKFLFGGKSKKAETETSATTAQHKDPWAPAIPSLYNVLGEINASNNTMPLFSDYENAGYSALAEGAGRATGALDAAIGENNKTLSGAYLTPDTNPYLADIAKRVGGLAGSVQNATFGGRGRSGSGLAGYYSGKGTTDAITDLYGRTYESERGRMGEAVGNAPGLAQGAMMPGTALIGAGQEISNRPMQRLATKAGLLSNIAGLGGDTTGRVDSNETVYGRSSGLLGSIFNAATNKVFGTSLRTN